MAKRRSKSKSVITSGNLREEIRLSIGKFTFVVKQANLLMRVRRSKLFEEISKLPPTGDLEQDAVRLYFYPRMAGCSEGNVPTLEEFCELLDIETDEWYKACYEKNPHWFDEDKEISPEELKKKES